MVVSAVTNKLGDFLAVSPLGFEKLLPRHNGDCAAETIGRSVGQYVIQLTERVQVFSVSVKPPERRRA